MQKFNLSSNSSLTPIDHNSDLCSDLIRIRIDVEWWQAATYNNFSIKYPVAHWLFIRASIR